MGDRQRGARGALAPPALHLVFCRRSRWAVTGRHDLAGIVTAMKEAFDGVPADEVAQDVREFVEGMVESGFIGTMETTGSKG